MHKIFTSLLLITASLTTTDTLATTPDVSDFLFEKKIISQKQYNKEIQIPLTTKMLQAINPRFSNINLVDQNNEEVPFSVFERPIKKIPNLTITEISSKKDDNPQNLIDDDIFTSFSFNKRKDKHNASWAIIDLKDTFPLSRIKIFPKDRAQISYVEIQTGNTPEKLKTKLSKRKFERYLDISTPPVRYIKIKLWGKSIKIDDIKIIANEKATIYFTPKQDNNYKLLYGGKKVNLVKYKSRSNKPKTNNIKIAKLTNARFNPLAPKDFDTDGIFNKEDNCPETSNPSQRDKDKDLIGDLCDNAPNIKNKQQLDTDRDHVGDVIDNCKLTENYDQNDRDSDGWGDACDNAYTPIDTTNHPLLTTGIFFISILALGTIAYISRKTFKYLKKNKIK